VEDDTLTELINAELIILSNCLDYSFLFLNNLPTFIIYYLFNLYSDIEIWIPSRTTRITISRIIMSKNWIRHWHELKDELEQTQVSE